MVDENQGQSPGKPEASSDAVPGWAKELITSVGTLRTDLNVLKKAAAAPKPDGGFVDDDGQTQAIADLTKTIAALDIRVTGLANVPTEQLRKEVAERLKVKPESLANTPIEVLQAMKTWNPLPAPALQGTDGASGRGTFAGGASQDDKDFIASANEADWSTADLKRAGDIVKKIGLRR